MTSGRWLVVGISGATCSGKSTLANRIGDSYPGSVTVRQDDYFLPPDDSRHVRIPELNHMNWDVITSLDMKRMHSDVTRILRTREKRAADPRKSILILDGFLLFKDKAITDLCDLKYFLTLTKEQCWERRRDRVYDPPDVPGYFDRVVWPEYEKYINEVVQDRTVTFIDGSRDMGEIYEMVSKEINRSLS